MPLLVSEKAPTYGVCYGVAILLADSFYSSVAVLHADYQPTIAGASLMARMWLKMVMNARA